MDLGAAKDKMGCGEARKRKTWGFHLMIAGPGLKKLPVREGGGMPKGVRLWVRAEGRLDPMSARGISNSPFSEPSGATPRHASGAPRTRKGPRVDWVRVSSGARSPARPQSSPGLSSPCPLGRRGAPRGEGSPRPRQSFPALKCRFWLPRESPPCPRGAPGPGSFFVPPLAEGATLPGAPQRRAKVRRHSTFLNSFPAPLSCNHRGAPRASEAALPQAREENLGFSGACARGVDLQWIVRHRQDCR